MNSGVLRASLYYVGAGIPVLPVSGKLPLTKNGLSDATTQEAKVRFWFESYNDAGVAIACGHPLRSGGHLLAFDVDAHRDGDHYLEEMERENGPVPVTWTIRTPSGGWHYYFRTEEPFRTCVDFRPGLELRGVGAYVVAPPSPGYAVEKRAGIAECPRWLLEAASSKSEVGPAPALDEVIPEGQRDVVLASLAGSLRRRGLVAEEILPTLLAVNDLRCRPPLPERDVVRIARSIARRPAAHPLVLSGGRT